MSILGRYPTLEDLADGSFGNALDQARQRNGGLYTGAFILCATDAYGQSAKHRNHVELFRHMFLHDQLGAKLLESKSLCAVYKLPISYLPMGDFTSPPDQLHRFESTSPLAELQRERIHPGGPWCAARHQEVFPGHRRLLARRRSCKKGMGPKGI